MHSLRTATRVLQVYPPHRPGANWLIHSSGTHNTGQMRYIPLKEEEEEEEGEEQEDEEAEEEQEEEQEEGEPEKEQKIRR